MNETDINTINGIRHKYLPNIMEMVDGINVRVPCKELQLVVMDLVSIDEHLVKILNDGPSAPFTSIPLNDSVVTEEPPLFT